MLYAALILEPEILGWLILDCRLLGVKPIRLQVDTDYKLKDMKKIYKELKMKGKGYKKKLDDLHNDLSNQMEQIQKDLVDPKKLQAILADESLAEACDLRKGLEMVALIEAQLKEMNLNLDSISEYRIKVSLYNEQVADPNSVTQQRDDVKRQYDEWRKKRLDEFVAGFNIISLRTYTLLYKLLDYSHPNVLKSFTLQHLAVFG